MTLVLKLRSVACSYNPSDGELDSEELFWLQWTAGRAGRLAVVWPGVGPGRTVN